jgi:exodeoxyribonuclease VII large subunit
LQRFDDAKEALLDAALERTAALRRRLELARATLEAASPLSVLERGFALVVDAATGKALRRASDAPEGTLLRIRPMEGELTARVTPPPPREQVED